VGFAGPVRLDQRCFGWVHNWHIQYDAFGRRASKAVVGTTASFLYDDLNGVQELSGSTPVANRLTGGVDEFFNRADSTGTDETVS